MQPLQVGNSPTRLSALLTGQVAAALLAEAFVDQAVAQGMRVLISLEKEDRPYLTAAESDRSVPEVDMQLPPAPVLHT